MGSGMQQQHGVVGECGRWVRSRVSLGGGRSCLLQGKHGSALTSRTLQAVPTTLCRSSQLWPGRCLQGCRRGASRGDRLRHSVGRDPPHNTTPSRLALLAPAPRLPLCTCTPRLPACVPPPTRKLGVFPAVWIVLVRLEAGGVALVPRHVVPAANRRVSQWEVMDALHLFGATAGGCTC